MNERRKLTQKVTRIISLDEGSSFNVSLWTCRDNFGNTLASLDLPPKIRKSHKTTDF